MKKPTPPLPALTYLVSSRGVMEKNNKRTRGSFCPPYYFVCLPCMCTTSTSPSAAGNIYTQALTTLIRFWYKIAYFLIRFCLSSTLQMTENASL